jgi:hypothetical protein
MWVKLRFDIGSSVKDLFDSAEQSARHAPDPDAVCLKHDPEKWQPVFGKDYAQTKTARAGWRFEEKSSRSSVLSALRFWKT